MTKAEHEALTHAAQSLKTATDEVDRLTILSWIDRLLDRVNRKTRGQLTHAEAMRHDLLLED